MSIKLIPKGDLKKAITELRSALKKELTTDYFFDLIVKKRMAKGISPVKNQKWVKYSKSYVAQINGKVSFFTSKTTGMVHPMPGVANPIFGAFGKKVRPVNLKLSGVLWESFYTKQNSRGIVIGFSDPVAKYHNDEGAGKSKTVRPMLPTHSGDEWNSGITAEFRTFVNEIAIKVLKKYKKPKP